MIIYEKTYSITVALCIAVLASVLNTGCNDDKSNITTVRTTTFDGVQDKCTNGGVKIEVLVDGSVDDAQTQYICNGAQGQAGTNTSVQTSTFDGKQGNCTNGGIKVEPLIDGVVQTAQTQYICNGADGQIGNNGHNGENGQNGHNSLVISSTEVGDICANGGLRIDSGLDTNDNNTLDADEILITRHICNGTNGQDASNGTNGTNANIQTTTENPGEHCENGGVKIEVLVDDVVQTGLTKYICNGENGTDGTNGTNANIQTTTENPGEHCENGGVKIEVLVDDVVQTGLTKYICNGENGTDGKDGTNANIRTTTENPGDNCINGGVKVEVLIDNIVQTGLTKYICNGENGTDGKDGTNANIRTTTENPGDNCINGGVKVEVLIDNIVQTGLTKYICNGENGTDGKDGTNATIQTLAFDGYQYGCDNGGVILKIYVDGNLLEDQTQYICNGTNGGTSLDVGDTIIFGRYEQDNDETNGQEPISWIVLDKNDAGQYLIISEKVLDVHPYHSTFTEITWENSTIRSWLNGYGQDYSSSSFINTAFVPAEQAKIVASYVYADKTSSDGDANPDNYTVDKIFMLSLDEANLYFTSNSARIADATQYAIKKKAYVCASTTGEYGYDGTCADVHCYARWWLRTPSRSAGYATYVHGPGELGSNGYSVNSSHIGVRPALWGQF